VSDRIQRSETASALREANSLFSLGKADEARRRLSEQKAKVEAQAHAAASTAPARRAKDLDDDCADQRRELDRAEQGFAAPPAPPAGAAPAPASRDLKSNEKRNVAKAVELGL
jgi:Ca-activated chloride channel family protein